MSCRMQPFIRPILDSVVSHRRVGQPSASAKILLAGALGLAGGLLTILASPLHAQSPTPAPVVVDLSKGKSPKPDAPKPDAQKKPARAESASRPLRPNRVRASAQRGSELINPLRVSQRPRPSEAQPPTPSAADSAVPSGEPAASSPGGIPKVPTPAVPDSAEILPFETPQQNGEEVAESSAESPSDTASERRPPKRVPVLGTEGSTLLPSTTLPKVATPATDAANQSARVPAPAAEPELEDSATDSVRPLEKSPEPPNVDKRMVVSPPLVKSGTPLTIPTDRTAKTASFHNVTPGITSRADVLEKLVSEQKLSDSDDRLVFRVGPFPRVTFQLTADQVTSIIVQLDEPISPETLSEELQLKLYTPAPIPDERGDIVGRVYPERGVYFIFQPADAETELKVAQIIIEPLAPEPFVLRAKHDTENRYTENLSDLEFALRQDPKHAEAYWMKAQLLAKLGRYTAAKGEVAEALRLQPHNPRFQLTNAHLLGVTGQRAQAVSETQRVLDQSDLAAEYRAWGLVQLSELLSQGPAPDFSEALARSTRAIEVATPLMRDEVSARRRLAKEVMVRAHIAIAGVVARGDFRGKESVLPKWIDQATQLAEQFVRRDEGSVLLPLRIQHRTLAVAVSLDRFEDTSVAARTAVSQAQELTQRFSDPLFQAAVHWELGQALASAAEAQLKGTQYESTRELANEALRNLVRGARHRELSLSDEYRIARLYYVGGASFALGEEDHVQAVAWYDQTELFLGHTVVESDAVHEGELGDQLISMGVSYWETGQRERALELTEEGLQLVMQAVRKGQRLQATLAVPYGNLSTMYREQGDEAEAKKFAARAKEVETR